MRVIPAAAFVFALLLPVSASAAPCDGFVDVSDGDIFCAAVTFLKNKGITLGCTDSSHFCPNDYVPRWQMALFLQRMGKGGPNNTLGGATTTIGGGDFNLVSNIFSTVGGGANNTASNPYSTVSGGAGNTASGPESTIPGGLHNIAFGATSFAAGNTANANYDGCFVWGDYSTLNEVRCDAANRYVVRAVGGIYMFTGGSMQGSYTGAGLAPGATAWTVQSDRASKDNVQLVDAMAVLRKVATMPIATWNWKSQDAAIRHMGPMAQDFHAAFGLGETPKGISTVDADGVALAAIQGLNQELESLRAEMVALRSALATLLPR